MQIQLYVECLRILVESCTLSVLLGKDTYPVAQTADWMGVSYWVCYDGEDGYNQIAMARKEVACEVKIVSFGSFVYGYCIFVLVRTLLKFMITQKYGGNLNSHGKKGYGLTQMPGSCI